MPITANSTAYIDFTNTGDSVTGWPKDEKRFYGYSSALSCDEGKAQFMALSLAQKIAQTDTAPPAAPVGKRWQIRACGGGAVEFVITDWQEEAEPAEVNPPVDPGQPSADGDYSNESGIRYTQ